MKVIVAGGTGLIGKALTKSLVSDGHDVVILTRGTNSDSVSHVTYARWDGRTTGEWVSHIDGADAVVNLTGENLSSGLWTKARKQAILNSRVDAGKAITEAIQQAAKKPSVLVQSSGVGFYGTRQSGLLAEDAPSGDDFLAHVSREWEASTQPVEAMGVRRVVIRTAVVLSNKGGALDRLLLPFKLFVGGPLGSGKQWMSWIHMKDQVRAICFLIENPAASGAFNLSAEPVTNHEFSRITGKIMKRPAFIRVPAIALRLLLGEMSTVVLDGQRVSAEKLTRLGFKFDYPDLDSALVNLLKY